MHVGTCMNDNVALTVRANLTNEIRKNGQYEAIVRQVG